eukprot:scaffold153312_cov31-Tisochrysis_lutea.AAC.1
MTSARAPTTPQTPAPPLLPRSYQARLPLCTPLAELHAGHFSPCLVGSGFPVASPDGRRLQLPGEGSEFSCSDIWLVRCVLGYRPRIYSQCICREPRSPPAHAMGLHTYRTGGRGRAAAAGRGADK